MDTYNLFLVTSGDHLDLDYETFKEHFNINEYS
ncbi:hypothetical protein Bsel_1038 [[Bacillus] selenitireducens MLS10]|uniref:Uncharacterized protein n=1 Tax=Bacillus selenitireducens (strain ATCC 700615 / DSM 15326 / MLS10) TaxID=439292 RepID=D6Y0G6_BACIE|nr:hypothetical protein Bsel_1038 [[Bacillus] selenitireducens MLS10]